MKASKKSAPVYLTGPIEILGTEVFRDGRKPEAQGFFTSRCTKLTQYTAATTKGRQRRLNDSCTEATMSKLAYTV